MKTIFKRFVRWLIIRNINRMNREIGYYYQDIILAEQGIERLRGRIKYAQWDLDSYERS